MPASEPFPALFARLKSILEPYQARMIVGADDPNDYLLNTPYAAQYKRELFFSGVKMGKSYVSFHLMPVYMFPDLLDGVSPQLKKRMQGKSCFNFKVADETLLAELTELTAQSVARLENEHLSALKGANTWNGSINPRRGPSSRTPSKSPPTPPATSGARPTTASSATTATSITRWWRATSWPR